MSNKLYIDALTISLVIQLPIDPGSSAVADVTSRIEAFMEDCRAAGAGVTIHGPNTDHVQSILVDLRVKLEHSNATDEERRELEERIAEAEAMNRFRRRFIEQPERAN